MLAGSSKPGRTASLELPVHLQAETQRQKYNNYGHCANLDWIKIELKGSECAKKCATDFSKCPLEATENLLWPLWFP